MHTQKAFSRIIVLIINLFLCVLTRVQAQDVTENPENRSGVVNVTATPATICVGQSAQLHAEAITGNIVDFETGDFSQANFVFPSSNAWEITTTHPYGGSDYCMKSNNEGIANSTSYIEAVVNVPYDAFVSFFVRVSSETSWDFFHFYIDGVEQGQGLSGQVAYLYQVFYVTSGVHTYKWEYKKDSSVNSYDDCVYVDDIILYQNASVNDILTINFETGNLSQFNNNLSAYPWVITNSYAASGSKCMKSNNQGVHNSSSIISLGYAFPDNGFISFDANCMGEGSYTIWDKCIFYIDNVEQFRHGQDVSGWHNYYFMVNPGSHTFKWEYNKDSSIHESGDAFAVDNIVLGVVSTSGGTQGSNFTYNWEPGDMTGPDITVSPAQTTTYTVTAVDENGTAIGTAQQTIVVEPVPVVNITTSTGETSICEGETITLSASVSGTDYYLAGDILCTDGSIVHPSDWPCGKTAKAIVFYVDATGQHGWAIDLEQNNQKFKWSSEKYSIPGLQSYANFMEAISDLDGYSNTQKIRSFGNSSKYPAAWAVDFDQDWYLPAIGQLNILFGAYFAVKTGLEAVLGSAFNEEDLWSGDLWSSTANTSDNSWMIRNNNGYVWNDPKSASKKVRAVINF